MKEMSGYVGYVPDGIMSVIYDIRPNRWGAGVELWYRPSYSGALPVAMGQHPDEQTALQFVEWLEHGC